MFKKSLLVLFLLIHAQASSFWKIPGIPFAGMAYKAASAKSIIATLAGKARSSVSMFQSVAPVTPFSGSSLGSMKNIALVGKDKFSASLVAFVAKVRSLASQGQLERFDAMKSFAVLKKQSTYEALVAFKARAQCVAQGKPIISGVAYSTSTAHTAAGVTGSSSWAKASSFCKASVDNASHSFTQNNTQMQYKWYSLFGPKFYNGIPEAIMKAQKSASFWKGSFFGSVSTAAAVAWMQNKPKKLSQNVE